MTEIEKFVLWVIDEVSTVEELIRDVKDSSSYQFTVDSVVEVIRSKCIWIYSFILEDMQFLVDIFVIVKCSWISLSWFFVRVVEWAVKEEIF